MMMNWRKVEEEKERKIPIRALVRHQKEDIRPNCRKDVEKEDKDFLKRDLKRDFLIRDFLKRYQEQTVKTWKKERKRRRRNS